MMNQRDSNFKWSNKIKEIRYKVGRADLHYGRTNSK